MRRLLIGALLSLLCGPALAQQAPIGFNTLNGSSTITAGNTFQTILTANSKRRSLTIQNNNTNGDNCWLFIGSGTAAKATSILLGQGGSYQRYYPYLPADAIQITCTTTSDTFYLDTQ